MFYSLIFFSNATQKWETASRVFQTKRAALSAARRWAREAYVREVRVYAGQAGGMLVATLGA